VLPEQADEQGERDVDEVERGAGGSPAVPEGEMVEPPEPSSPPAYARRSRKIEDDHA
jgi:hypothetical protein